MPIDLNHGQFVPTGQVMSGQLARIFRRIADGVASAVANGQSYDYSRWLPMLAEAAGTSIGRHYQQGLLIARRRIERARRKAEKTKAFNPTGLTEDGDPFSVFLPQVAQYARMTAYQFAQSTLNTIAGDVANGLAAVRQSIADGLTRGDTLTQLTRAVQHTIADPLRAQRVAATEASRAMHAGQIDAAKSEGITHLRWLASSDACPKCTKLDGNEVEIGTAFMVDARGGVYAAIFHPPAHPFCMCTVVEVIGDPPKNAPVTSVTVVPPAPAPVAAPPSVRAEPYPVPKNVSFKLSGNNANAVASQFFGEDADKRTAAAVGFEGGKVSVLVQESNVWDGKNYVKKSFVATQSEGKNGEFASRRFTVTSDGKKVCENEYFRIPENSPLKGKGAEIFGNQVEALTALGYDRIDTVAGGDAESSKKPGGYNGYYTWPLLGYDGQIPGGLFRKLPAEIQAKMGKSRSILDLYAIPGGKEAWKKHGGEIDLQFDLKPESRSQRVLAEYLERKRAKSNG